MFKHKNILLLAFLFLATYPYNKSFAQTEFMQFKVYGFEEGLTHRNTFKIQQDPLGYIWIATIQGLNKFDGQEFIHYTSSSKTHRIPENFISDLVISNDSLIYLAHQSGMTCLNPNSNQSYPIESDSTSMLFGKNRSFGNLYIDADQELWAASFVDSELNCYLQHSGDQKVLQDFLKSKGNYANIPIVQQDSFYFIGIFENELWKADKQANIIEKLTFDFPEGDPSFSRVIQLQTTKNKTLWALLDNGQLFFRPYGQANFEQHPITKEIYNKGVSTTFLAEEDGHVWIGGIGNLWYYIPNNQSVQDYGDDIKQLTKNTCKYKNIFKDDAGVIWIATDFGAVKIVKTEQLFTFYMSGGNESCTDGFCSMRGITADENGNVYFAYYNSIHVLNLQTNVVKPLLPQGSFFNAPFGILYHNNKLYTGNGISIDLQTKSVEKVFDHPSTDLGICMLDYEGVLWFGFREWIDLYNPETKEKEAFVDVSKQLNLDKLDVSYLYQGKTGNYIWLSTLNDGLYKIDKTKGVLAHYSTKTAEPKLLHDKVNVTYEDRYGNLWIGTGRGIHQLNIETEVINYYTVDDGMPNDFINGLLSEGDSCIWVSTDKGLSRLQVKEETFTNFTQKDGLTKDEFNRSSFYQSPDGRMYFGGLNGVNAFYPGPHFSEQKESYEAKLLFTTFSKYDGKLDTIITKTSGLFEKETIALNHNDKFFTFNYALANYKNPRENKYSYKLDGYEKDWSDASPNNSTRYNNIPAGKYVFRVRAGANKGVWNQKQLAIPIHIKQAFFRTWWFRLLCALGIAGLFYAAMRYRVYSIQERRLFLEKKVKSRTLELEREKKKSDDLLLNILPAETAEELKKHGKAQAKRYEKVSVLFADFKDFTRISELLEPEQLVAEIDYCFKRFDLIIEKYDLEKIKTIGDAYMCAGGIPVVDDDNPIKIIKAALEIQEFMKVLAKEKSAKNEPFFEARIGIHTGPVVTGIVGFKKFAYDIWGDSVNIASRMEGNGEVGKVNISETTFQLVKDHFSCNYRGKITAKNKGEIDMYFVEGRDWPEGPNEE